MKKIVSILMAIMLLCLSLTACGKKENNELNDNNSVITQNTESSTESDNASNDAQNWGVDENIITEHGDVNARAHIKFPYLAGITKGQGKVAYQTDKSLVILGAEIDFEEPSVDGNKTENILPAYFLKVKEIMKSYRRVDHSDFNFDIKAKEIKTVNDYEMCKYTGNHTFTVNGEQKSIYYVAYATKLKTNGAIVYWMVLDDTTEQSLGSTIESHADKMAESLHE